jgi:hypothetical protein
MAENEQEQKDGGYVHEEDPVDTTPENEEDDCPDLKPTDPPTPYKPPDCDKTPECNCPKPPEKTDGCFEDLIEAETKKVTIADNAKAFKAKLEALLTKAKAASQEYTPQKHAALVKLWGEQDVEIAELLRQLTCAVPCWRCVIECYVCPLLDELRIAEGYLNGDGTLSTEMHSIYDLRHWHERNVAATDRMFQRVELLLTAWESPAKTIEKALGDNAKLLADSKKAMGPDSSTVIYDVFLKLVPLHLAIAPPSDIKETKIAEELTVFCKCDEGGDVNCCGIDIGPWSLRSRLIGLQPKLISPDGYFGLICCLVEKLYQPAKDRRAEAIAGLEEVDNEIKRYKDRLRAGLDPKTFETNAKAKIPSPIECCGDKLCKPEPEPEQPPTQTAN